MAFKMSQEFPTISLDIAEEFHILHSIPSSKQTYNWLPNRHTRTRTRMQQQQLQTKSNWACYITC